MKRTTYLGKPFEIVDYDTRLGKLLESRCMNWEGEYLSQVYNNHSEAKQQAYNEWYELYCTDSKSSLFSIVSHNCQTFSLGWFTTLPKPIEKGYDRDVSILITKNHNYMIVYPG